MPKDWTKVQCNNCKEYGHTAARCKAPKAEDGDDSGNILDTSKDGPSVDDGATQQGNWAGGSGDTMW